MGKCMQNGELITIIVPVYNGARTIARCMDSLFNQTYKNYEVLVIDDGSTDNTECILRKYLVKYEQLHLYRIHHKGVSCARNMGIAKAKGKYIAFVDADDEVYPNYLEVLYTILKEKNAHISVCGIYHAASKKSMALNLKAESNTLGNLIQFNGKKFLERMEEPLRYEITTVCWNKLYLKNVFIDKYFPNGRIYEDSAMMQHILYPVQKIIETDQKLYIYHTETVGITRSKYNISKLDEVFYAGKRMQYFAHKKELQLYFLARKQYCIALLKHYYLMKKNGIKNKKILSYLRREQKYYLSGWKWKKILSLKTAVVFFLGKYAPFLCGAIIVKWDEFLEKRLRQVS